MSIPDLNHTIASLKHLIVRALNLQDIAPEQIPTEGPLFGQGLGLDSVDALELVVAIEKEFGLRAESHEIGKEAFASVGALARWVNGRLALRTGAAHG